MRSEAGIQQCLYSEYSRKGAALFLPNVQLYGWESDFLVITRAMYAVDFEIKLSKSDLRAEFANKRRKHWVLSGKEDGEKPKQFYFVGPAKVFGGVTLPPYAGLILTEQRASRYAGVAGWYIASTIHGPVLANEKIDTKQLLSIFTKLSHRVMNSKDESTYGQDKDRMD